MDTVRAAEENRSREGDLVPFLRTRKLRADNLLRSWRRSLLVIFLSSLGLGFKGSAPLASWLGDSPSSESLSMTMSSFMGGEG